MLACTLAVGVASGAALGLARPAGASGDRLLAPTGAELLDRIDHWRERTWYWQRVMGQPRYPTAYRARQTPSLAYRRWALQLWKKRALRAKRQAQRPPNRQGWLCIYRHESHPAQGWRTNTGNGYYGGLQMDISFQRSYGAWLLRRKGPAHRWTPIEQMWVAERARRARGWHPWPNTARRCGLI